VILALVREGEDHEAARFVFAFVLEREDQKAAIHGRTFQKLM
jgi:hypothetical protein